MKELPPCSQDYSGFCRCLCNNGREMEQYQQESFYLTDFQGFKILPKSLFVDLIPPPFLPLQSPGNAVFFSPWNPHMISKKLTYRFRDIFNIHKMKFLKSIYENATRSSLKTLILKTEQSPVSFLYCSCHFFLCSGTKMLPWNQKDQSNFWPQVVLVVVNYETNYSCYGNCHIAWSFNCKFSRITWKMRVEEGRALIGRKKSVNKFLNFNVFCRMN